MPENVRNQLVSDMPEHLERRGFVENVNQNLISSEDVGLCLSGQHIKKDGCCGCTHADTE